jgi:hypothetical protein
MTTRRSTRKSNVQGPCPAHPWRPLRTTEHQAEHAAWCDAFATKMGIPLDAEGRKAAKAGPVVPDRKAILAALKVRPQQAAAAETVTVTLPDGTKVRGQRI